MIRGAFCCVVWTLHNRRHINESSFVFLVLIPTTNSVGIRNIQLVFAERRSQARTIAVVAFGFHIEKILAFDPRTIFHVLHLER